MKQKTKDLIKQSNLYSGILLVSEKLENTGSYLLTSQTHSFFKRNSDGNYDQIDGQYKNVPTGINRFLFEGNLRICVTKLKRIGSRQSYKRIIKSNSVS